jgi:hypothetical protein
MEQSTAYAYRALLVSASVTAPVSMAYAFDDLLVVSALQPVLAMDSRARVAATVAPALDLASASAGGPHAGP